MQIIEVFVLIGFAFNCAVGQVDPDSLYTFKNHPTTATKVYCTINASTDFIDLYHEDRPDRPWYVQGYWDGNFFVASYEQYNPALQACRKKELKNKSNYRYVQPKSTSGAGWYNFVITTRLGTGVLAQQIQPGYDPRPVLYNISIYVYCTRDDAKDYRYLYEPIKNTNIQSSTYWQISGYWNENYFFVDARPYYDALRTCQKLVGSDGTNYSYIQPAAVPHMFASGWFNFKIKGSNQIMPGFAGKAPTGSSRVLCTKNSKQSYGYVFENNKFWYIFGEWDGDYFVVNQTAYDEVLKLCQCYNFLYAQPADTKGWYRFVIRKGEIGQYNPTGQIMPGFDLKTISQIVCTTSYGSDVQILRVPPVPPQTYKTYREPWWVKGTWYRDFFVVKQSDYDAAFQECQKFQAPSGWYYFYVQPGTARTMKRFKIKESGQEMKGFPLMPTANDLRIAEGSGKNG